MLILEVSFHSLDVVKLPGLVDLPLPRCPRSRPRNLRRIQDEGRETRTRSYLPVPCDPEVSFSITWSRLKLAGFCRIGYSLKLSSHLATTACAGTMTNPRGAK